MKKTVFISALLLCSFAFGETNLEYCNSTYGVFTKTTSYDINRLTFTLGDNVTATLTSKKDLFTRPSDPSVTWTNTAALTAMNNDLGLNIGADDVRTFTRPGYGTDFECALTLDFSQSTVYEAGDTITLYIVAAYRESDNVNGVYTPTITGLTVTSTSYASGTGSGFDSTLTGIAANGSDSQLPTLMKLTGVLGEDRIITIDDTGHRRFGVGMVALKGNIPEPTTATLSLLALAGLCARRRRK